MKLAGKYSKFNPMAGFETLLASEGALSGMGLIPEEGIPLEILQGTSNPQTLREEGLQQGPPGVGGLGGPIGRGPGFGGPIEVDRIEPTYTTDIPIKAEYSNIYGTNVNARYNPTTGALSGGATVPIGAAEQGYRFGIEGSYSPGIMQYDGLTPPPGYSGMIKFSRTNPIDPKTFETPGRERYSFGLGIEGTPRRVPPRRPVPVQFVPPGL